MVKSYDYRGYRARNRPRRGRERNGLWLQPGRRPDAGDHSRPKPVKTRYRDRWPGYHYRKGVAKIEKLLGKPTMIRRGRIRRALTEHVPLSVRLHDRYPDK